MQVIWFKRDLRLTDHLPLLKASQAGKCVCLYVYEPELLHSPEFDSSHLQFINQSLQELDQRLRAIGGWMTYRVGTLPAVFEQLHAEAGIDAIWSHEETGNHITYQRDLRVQKWASTHDVPWHEFPQNGVVRRLKSRDGWSNHWNQFMSTSCADTVTKITCDESIPSGTIQNADDLGLPASEKTDLQVGGESTADQVLQNFLEYRGRNYRKEMSSPVTARDACSRLSPYLAWGCISMKQVVRQLRERESELRTIKKAGNEVGPWLGSLSSFRSRLSWHCHFMQKLEDQPSIEFENMNRAYDGLREEQFNQSYFDAWCRGDTGYPLVDACMRALHQHSWINFRMRAMLVSFASYHLWLHWRPTAVYLAKHFLDFEPGIHFSQFQMQSGTTGINTIRIYSPIKQVLDHDPTGEIIKLYVPELTQVPDKYLAEPHKMPSALQDKIGCIIGKHYPKPIVEHATAYQEAKSRIYTLKGKAKTQQEAKKVYQKHGSRKRPRA